MQTILNTHSHMIMKLEYKSTCQWSFQINTPIRSGDGLVSVLYSAQSNNVPYKWTWHNIPFFYTVRQQIQIWMIISYNLYTCSDYGIFCLQKTMKFCIPRYFMAGKTNYSKYKSRSYNFVSYYIDSRE